MAQKQTVVGIDVSKGTLDAAIRSADLAATFANTLEGRRDLLKWLTEHSVRKAVMEATGGYEISCRKLRRRMTPTPPQRSWAGIDGGRTARA